MIDLRQLKYFVAMVDAGSLTRAAASLYIAQPALSQQLASLEEELSVRLLNRSATGVRPTEAGLALYRHAQMMLKLESEIKNITRGAGEKVSGRVRLGLPSTIAVVLVAPLMKALRTAYPAILLEIYESPSTYLVPQLLEQRVDLSILVDDAPASGIKAEPLLVEPLYFVHVADPHPLQAPATVRLSDLKNIPIVLPSRSTTLRHLVDRAFREAGIEPHVEVETSSIQTLLTLVAQGNSGTFVPYSALTWHAAKANLHASLVEPQINRRAWLAQSANMEPTQASLGVSDVIRSVTRDLVDQGNWQGAILAP